MTPPRTWELPGPSTTIPTGLRVGSKATKGASDDGSKTQEQTRRPSTPPTSIQAKQIAAVKGVHDASTEWELTPSRRPLGRPLGSRRKASRNDADHGSKTREQPGEQTPRRRSLEGGANGHIVRETVPYAASRESPYLPRRSSFETKPDTASIVDHKSG